MRTQLEQSEVAVLVALQEDMNGIAARAHEATTVDELRTLVADQGLLFAQYLLLFFGVTIQAADPAELLDEHRQKGAAA